MKAKNKSVSSEEETYIVQKVTDIKKNQNGKIEIYIKWKGYPQSQNTWEPLEHLEEDPLAILRCMKENQIKQQEKKETKLNNLRLKLTREAITVVKVILKDRSNSAEENIFSSESSKKEFDSKFNLNYY